MSHAQFIDLASNDRYGRRLIDGQTLSETAIRKAEVIYFLQTHGPLSSRQLAELCGVAYQAMHQWLHSIQNRTGDWVLMPNLAWLLTEEEPIEVEFDPLPHWVQPRPTYTNYLIAQ